VLGILCVLGILIVLGAVAYAIDGDPLSTATDLALQGAFALSLIGVPLAFAIGTAPRGEALARLGLRRADLTWIGWGFVAVVGFFIVMIPYTLLLEPETQETVDVIADEQSVAALIALGVLVIVAAPISEEIFFRGFFFGSLRRHLPFWGAMVISGLLFGLVHVPTGPLQAPPLALFGMALAWLYERSGSLLPPIAAHAFLNWNAFMITLADR
jgi:membrane protease YdiL (CAAX protease family)